jgi:MFS family permease
MGALGLILAAVWLMAYYAPVNHPRMSASELEYIRAGEGLVDLGAATSANTKGPRLADILQLFRSRMLVGIFIAQYGITSITWFFVSWFPSYLIKARGFSVMEASLIATVPAMAGFVGGVVTGFFSDWLLRRTGSLSIARKTPITIGLGMSALIIGCNYTDSSIIIVALMSAAFFGKGFGSLGWTVVADTAPKEIIGLTGGVFNALGNTAGIITPVVIGYILAGTGSFNGALLYVGLHGLIAIFSYWIIVGPIQRMTLDPNGGLVSSAALSTKPTASAARA